MYCTVSVNTLILDLLDGNYKERYFSSGKFY